MLLAHTSEKQIPSLVIDIIANENELILNVSLPRSIVNDIYNLIHFFICYER